MSKNTNGCVIGRNALVNITMGRENRGIGAIAGLDVSANVAMYISNCKYCGGKQRSMKAINEIIYYCPRCQR